MPRPNCCHTLLAFHLKLLNFLQTFIGVSLIIYSAWMLNRWNNHGGGGGDAPPPSAPSPQSSANLMVDSHGSNLIRAQLDYNHRFDVAAGIVSGLDDDFRLTKLPTPWFIYSVMGVGVLLCSVTCIGHIASEAINGCCLCFYSLLLTAFILLEAGIAAFLTFDKQWVKDLPNETTGELDSLRSFIENNMDVCKWVGISVLIIQALSLLLALILRTLTSTRNPEYDSDDDYGLHRDRARQPLLNPQQSHAIGSTSTDNKGVHSDIWSNRIRAKYGLHGGDNVNLNLRDTNPSTMSTSSEDTSRCSIV